MDWAGHEATWQAMIAVCIGLGLAASCGFRVFVPLLLAGAAARAGWLTVADGFEWIGSWPAIGAFGVATVLEIVAYYVPWLDNLLDSIATPAAMIAGIVAAAASIAHVDPMLQWSVAVIAGGGSAGLIKAGAAGLRLGSSALTFGLANPIISTIEWIVALVLAVLSFAAPFLAAGIALVLVLLLARFAWRTVSRFFGRSTGKPATVAK